MTKIKDAALAYAARGWPVLALQTNDEQGCTCRAARCKSPGKHPRQDLSPEGVKSATTDPKVIAGWPDGINIGVALGHGGLMAFDVDDMDAAALLMQPDMVLHDQTGLVVTGRPGAHVYFTCTGDTRTRHLRRDSENGPKLGEIRGVGSYVVAPPSVAPSLKLYRWVGRPQDDFTPGLATTADALAYVRELFRAVGVVIVPSGGGDSGGNGEDTLKGVPLLERDLPPLLAKDSSLMRVRQILSGTLPKTVEPDRSGQLFRLAREVADAAAARNVPLTAEELAGIVKRADVLYYDKYVGDARAGRRSEAAADHLLRQTARNGMRAATKQPPAGSQAKPDGADSGTGGTYDDLGAEEDTTGNVASVTYAWDADDGRLSYVIPRAKGFSYQPVANFLPILKAEVTVDRGGQDTEVVWRVLLQLQDGRSQLIELRSADYESSFALEKALSTKLTSEYIVYAGQYKHIKPALQELTPSEQVERYKRRAVPGWHEFGMGRVFLLPGVNGALGKDGIDTSVRMRDDDSADGDDPINDPAFAQYGKGVRPPATEEERQQAWEALVALVDAGKHEVTVPIVLQILAGPLRAAGAGVVPPLVHVVGRTGYLKTAYCLAALSLFGTFERTAPVSWLSTSPAILRSLLYGAKDLPLLVDDFKEDAGINKVGLLELVQNYADKTARRRATPTGKARRAEPPRCILLSNGEDQWERQASSVARTIVVGVEERDIVDERLAVAQDLIQRGQMQLFGGAFLQWLAGQDDMFENQTVDQTREELFQRMNTRYTGPAAHRRILQSSATLVAVGRVLLQFARETQPEYADTVMGWLKTLWRYFLEGLQERADTVAALSPFHQLTSYLAHAMAARDAVLFPADGMTVDRHRYPPDAVTAVVVGWWSEDEGGRFAHISANRTFSWYKGQLRRQGEEPVFGWQAFLQEARSEHGAVYEKRRFTSADGSRSMLRVVTLPLDSLIDQPDEYGVEEK